MARIFTACFLFSSRRRHTRCSRDWSSDVCSSDLSETSANFPAAFRKMRLGCASFASNPPPATNKSGQPSLSKSTSPQPQPLHGRLRASSPVDALPSSKEPPPRFRNTSYVSFFSPVITRSSRPSPSTSPKSAPIPEMLRPSPLYATPDSVAISWKPSPVDRKSKLRALSLATNKPGRASPRKSAMATPMPLPSTSGNPSLAIISVNVPSPLLWKSRSEEHTSELQSRLHLVCRLLLEKKKQTNVRYRLPIAHHSAIIIGVSGLIPSRQDTQWFVA